MKSDKEKNLKRNRREFLGALATGATALGMAALPTIPAAATEFPMPQQDLEAWFDQLKGKHRMVFDVTKPNEIAPFAWPRVFLNTNVITGTAEKDCSVLVVLRHDAIGYAFDSKVWEKYKLGEMFKANDPATKAAAIRNPFSNSKPGDYKIPGIGPVAIGINELQASGVLFCVCNTAMTKVSAILGASTNTDPAEVRKELVSAILPGIQVVPSGVWAVGRAQEHGCAYCLAG